MRWRDLSVHDDRSEMFSTVIRLQQCPTGTCLSLTVFLEAASPEEFQARLNRFGCIRHVRFDLA